MRKDYNALELHKYLKGKIKVNSKIKIVSKKNLSNIYTPGVAQAVNKISATADSIYDLTIKNNTIAVVTDGSAVLGMGNVGALAALPVMEGKCAIFAEFAGINAFPICIDTQKADEIVETVKNIAPVFGGINLEDISAPRCFEIEEKLQKLLNIPVMHDDQHATAIVVLAGLINAVKVIKKNLKQCKVVINGTGAAGSAVTKLLYYFGIKNILSVDSEGILSAKRKNLHPYKKYLVKITNPDDLTGDLEIACKDADILIGVSKKGLFNKKIISRMSSDPIVFALANPNPEISESDARKFGVAVYANGRSDCKNQINNALVFPGFFKGLLQKRKTKITFDMKTRAAIALSSLMKNPVKNFFIPQIFDKRIVPAIANHI